MTANNPGERKWRRTALTRADGSPVPDDWSLVDERLGVIARIYRVIGGPQDGRWFWAVQIDAQGRPWNGGTGQAADGRGAREAVEAILGLAQDKNGR